MSTDIIWATWPYDLHNEKTNNVIAGHKKTQKVNNIDYQTFVQFLTLSKCE